ncbi:MAG: ABC transporter permease [Propionibacteriaceae bacterium]|nr:ABC transporter permease [Propionibacteriaceae bacterium]
MTATTTDTTTGTTATRSTTPAARFGRAFAAHLRSESRLLGRDGAALIFGAVLPLAAIIVMSAIPAAREPQADFGGLSVLRTYQPVIVLFATSVLGLTIVPAILGGYRQAGILRRLRTTPASPATLLAALFVVVFGVGLLVSALIVAIPALVGVGLPDHLGWFALAGVLTLLAFLALGTVLAAVVPSPQVAAGLGNVVAALMWFSAGLWLPRQFFPDWLVTLTNLIPGGAAATAMTDATLGVQPSWQPFVVLVAWTVLGALVAVRTFRWE